MRLSALLLTVLLGSSAALAGGLEVVRVIPEYQPADSFVRISEYFSGKENTRGATIVRTQPGSREGFYFTIRTKSAAAIELAWIELQYIGPVSPETRTESFAISIPAGSHITRFGLTGKDWTSAKAKPAAWKIRFLGADGAELATEQSYLWSKPDAPLPAKKAG